MGLHLLADTSLELKEVASLLGYDDVNSYYRAFRRWEKVSPSQWRRFRA
ncbi:helix-turn-helix domain-containing protein [Pseudomonas sp. CP4]